MAHAANRPRFALAVARCEQELRVLRFTGDERLSAPFAFTIDVACTDPDLDLATLLDCEALLQIDSPASDLSRPRMVHGAICRAELLVSGKRWSQYRLHLAPRLYWLGLRYNVRIFQDMTAPDIVRQLLQEAGLDNARFRFELSRAYRRRTYCVQYNESELAFIQRLLADEGIHYHFEHLEDRHVAVFGDHGQSFKPLTPRAVAFRADAAMVGEPVISRFEPQRSLVLDAFASTDYNFRKPGHSQFVNAQAGSASQQEHYQWPGGHEDTSQGDQIVKDRLAQARVEQDLAEGASSVVQLVPGQVFQLQQHRRADFNQDWLLLSLHHEGTQPQVLEEEAPDDQGTQYHNTLTAIPASQTYRPTPCTKPQVPGVQTAVVTGPPGEQIYTDEHGRIKVRFHWDREGKNSCWLRLDQGWADHNWGSMVLPRVGQEVVVSFLHGDPDQPLVTGCLYHGLHKTPYPLPDHRSRSVLRSQSLSGNGGHELMLEDRAGQEKIAVHSARDFELHVTQDAHTSIDRHAQTHIAADDLLAIQGSDHLQVQGERRSQIDGQDSLTIGASQHLKAGTAIHVQAGQEIHLKAGSVLHIDAGMELSIQGGGSSLALNPAGVFLTGPLINLNSGGGAGSAVAASPKAPKLPTQFGGPKAGKEAASRPEMVAPDGNQIGFKELRGVPATAIAAESEILHLLQQPTVDAPPGQLDTLMSLLNDAARKDPDVGSILAMEGSEGQGIVKRWSNAATGDLLFPTKLTHAEEQSLLSKFRNLYGGNDTARNALDIQSYNEKPLFGSDAISHGDLSDTTEIASLAAGIVGLLKHAPQFAAKVKSFGLDDMAKKADVQTAKADTELDAAIALKRVTPQSFDEVKSLLQKSRQQLQETGVYSPKYTQRELEHMAQKGILEERFIVTLQKTKDPDDTIGFKRDSGRTTTWTTTIDQMERGDSDPKLLSDLNGIPWDPDARWEIIVIDQGKYFQKDGGLTFIPTYSNTAKLGKREFDKEFTGDQIDRVMTPEYSEHYATLMSEFKTSGKSPYDEKEIIRFAEETFAYDDQARADFLARHEFTREVGTNAYFSGDGLTKTTGESGYLAKGQHGTLETITFETNPATVAELEQQGAIMRFPAIPIR